MRHILFDCTLCYVIRAIYTIMWYMYILFPRDDQETSLYSLDLSVTVIVCFQGVTKLVYNVNFFCSPGVTGSLWWQRRVGQTRKWQSSWFTVRVRPIYMSPIAPPSPELTLRTRHCLKHTARISQDGLMRYRSTYIEMIAFL